MNIKFTRIVRSSPTVLPASNWQRSRWLIVATTLLLLFITIPAVWGANYHGRAIDADTGKPIEGAVVMVEWHKRAIYSMDGGGIFHNVRETLTDVDGRFSMDASEGINWNPLTYVQAPRIIAFFPGYLPFTPAYPEAIGIKGGLYEIAEALEKGAVIKMTKLKSDLEIKKYTTPTDLGPLRAPYSKIPNTIRLLNIHRKKLGLNDLSDS